MYYGHSEYVLIENTVFRIKEKIKAILEGVGQRLEMTNKK